MKDVHLMLAMHVADDAWTGRWLSPPHSYTTRDHLQYITCHLAWLWKDLSSAAGQALPSNTRRQGE